MRIGLIAPAALPVPPLRYGGTEAVIDQLARGFAAEGHEVLLWTIGDSTCPVPRGHVIERADPDHIGTASIELHHVISGYEAMDRWGADVVHDHTLTGPVYAARRPHLTVVTTNHCPFDEDLLELYRAVTPGVAVIAISADQASTADDVPIAAVIHHGVDLDAFPFGEGRGDEGGPYFVFLGRMAREKGAHRAAAAAVESGRRLRIAAKMVAPAEREYFEREVRPLLDDDIEYVGELGLDEKVRLLGEATALVNPIRWHEPFGLVMVEALACGTPVLSFAEGSAPEIVDHGVTGYLCHDVHDMACHMISLDRIDRRRCREVAAARFSSRRMVERHLDLYARLLRTQQPAA